MLICHRIIFTKSVQRCMGLSQLLVEQNFPAIAIHSAMTQEERLSKYQQFKNFEKRLLVATDLFGRGESLVPMLNLKDDTKLREYNICLGMDIERVNIVINYDAPIDSDTYLHRVARAGRFGTKGLAITFVSDDADSKVMNQVQDRFDISVPELPDELDLSLYIERKG